MPNTESLNYLTECIKIIKGHLRGVIKIIVTLYYNQNFKIVKEKYEKS